MRVLFLSSGPQRQLAVRHIGPELREFPRKVSPSFDMEGTNKRRVRGRKAGLLPLNCGRNGESMYNQDKDTSRATLSSQGRCIPTTEIPSESLLRFVFSSDFSYLNSTEKDHAPVCSTIVAASILLLALLSIVLGGRTVCLVICSSFAYMSPFKPSFSSVELGSPLKSSSPSAGTKLVATSLSWTETWAVSCALSLLASFSSWASDTQQSQHIQQKKKNTRSYSASTCQSNGGYLVLSSAKGNS